MHADLDPTSPNYDKLIDGQKRLVKWRLVMVRAVIFSGLWIAYQIISKKLSRAQDTASDNSNFKKNFKLSAAFLVVFLYSESMMSWDWIMSIDPHWFSTLFGWYLVCKYVCKWYYSNCFSYNILKIR